MRKMSKYASLFDKYGNVDEDKERHLGKIDWYGHMKINGTYSGSAFVAGDKDSIIAKDLIKASNPRGSILMEAKNYTDAQIANINSAAIVQQANTYTDTKFTDAKAYTDQKVATIGGGGVHCYVIQPQDYTAGNKYKFVYFTSKDIQGKQMSEADFFATALPPLHDYETNNYYPEIKNKVYLEQYPAQGRYQSQQVLFITITEYNLYVYTWDPAKNKVVANKALTWFSGGSDSNYWYINKQY